MLARAWIGVPACGLRSLFVPGDEAEEASVAAGAVQYASETEPPRTVERPAEGALTERDANGLRITYPVYPRDFMHRP